MPTGDMPGGWGSWRAQTPGDLQCLPIPPPGKPPSTPPSLLSLPAAPSPFPARGPSLGPPQLTHISPELSPAGRGPVWVGRAWGASLGEPPLSATPGRGLL